MPADGLSIGLDATYSIGDQLSGIGVYSREMLAGLPAALPEFQFRFFYRPNKFLRGLVSPVPPGCRKRPLLEHGCAGVGLFHGLNQRLPARQYRRAVATFHDLFVLTGEYSSPEYRIRFAQQARDAARRADLVIAISHFTASQVMELLGVEPGRVRVVPHGVHLPAQAPTGGREKIILSVGAIQKRKNVERLVDAFSRLEDPAWRLAIAGSAGYGAAAIHERIEASPRRDAIELRGYVGADKLRDLYARASIFAFPSLDEGFGMPVLEAMAWGVPVITSNRSALPEVAGDAALLVDPYDTDALTEALRRLISERELRAELIRKGLQRACAFPWAAAVQRTAGVYRELAG